MTTKNVEVTSPREAGRLFREWARDPSSAPSEADLIDVLRSYGVDITGFTKAKLIFDTDDTIHFVVRRNEMYQKSEDDEVSNPGTDYKLHPETRDIYSRYFDDNPSNDPNKREMFEMRIGEYCIGLCM